MRGNEFPVTRSDAERKGIKYNAAARYDAPFPTRLRFLRKACGLSQRDAADKLNVSKSTMGLWETGETMPDASNVAALAELYEVSTDYLLCQTSVASSRPDVREMCERLGLSELAISRLHAIAMNYPGMSESLNLLVESEYFSPILRCLLRCMNYGQTVPYSEEILKQNNLMPDHVDGQFSYEELMIQADKEAYRAFALYEPQRLLGQFAEQLIKESEQKKTAPGDSNTGSGKGRI